MKGLTPSQEKVLQFFARHVERLGSPPTLREIAQSVGSTYTNVGNCYVEGLVKKGMLIKVAKMTRGTRLTVEGRAYVRQLDLRGRAK